MTKEKTMGYDSRFSGEITIDPPLNAAALTKLDDYVVPAAKRWGPYDIRIRVETTERQTDEGTLTVRRGVAIVPVVTDESYKGYEIERHLRDLVEVLAEAGHDVAGVIRAEGADHNDTWRLVVASGEVHVERAKLVWPDGTEETR